MLLYLKLFIFSAILKIKTARCFATLLSDSNCLQPQLSEITDFHCITGTAVKCPH